MKEQKILALIPARGGSKSIPKKNIVNLKGYPLLVYSIAAAKLSRYIDRIIVSTDDEEIAGIARKYKAEVPFLRPKEFAEDSTGDMEWVIHALDFLEKNEGYVPDLIIHLRPTTPLRNPRVIDKAILEILEDKKATSLRSAQISDHTGYKLFRLKKEYCNFFGAEDFDEVEYYDKSRQLLPTTYIPNGQVDILIPKVIKETGLLHGKFIKAFITDKIADIDGYEDLEFAQKIIEKDQFKQLIEKVEELKDE